MALGCSTNSMLHIPAIAHECGIDLDLALANSISEKTPNLCHLAPAGDRYIEELNEGGGILAVMNEISKLGLLHTELMTCTEKRLRRIFRDMKLGTRRLFARLPIHTARPAASQCSKATWLRMAAL